MISKRELLDKITELQIAVRALERTCKEPTLSVRVVDGDGEVVKVYKPGWLYGPTQKFKELSFSEVCRALQDMCGIDITYQEIKDISRVVIYEKDD